MRPYGNRRPTDQDKAVADRYERIRIGLVGLGSWARKSFLPILAEREDVEVRAVAARTEATRKTAQELLGDGVALCEDYTELLEKADVDAVMVGLPPALTDYAVTAAVGAGMHVFVEPPIRAEALAVPVPDEMVFHADLELRYLPAVAKLGEIVSSGRLGRLLLVRVELDNDWGMHGEIREPLQASTVFGLGNWYVDLFDVFMQTEPVRVDIFGSYPRSSTFMEMGTATVQYSDGAVGEWAFNIRGGGDLELRLRVVGTDGQAEANLITGAYGTHTREGSETSGHADCSRPVHGFVGMRESIEAFLAAVQGGRLTASCPDTYRRLHSVLSALRCSEHEARSVRLDEAW